MRHELIGVDPSDANWESPNMEVISEPREQRSLWLARTLGVVIALIGLILLAGGGWLVALGGSAYYLLAGAGLLASGFFLFRGKSFGAWIFLAIFVATVPWAFWESGLDAWALVPRL